MKKFVNDPANFVPEFMAGVIAANSDLLEAMPEFQLIKRKDRPVADKVSIVQGSGSGHEPAHVCAVGPGMLSAACQGPVFAAPPAELYVLYNHAAKKCADAGLTIARNYVGEYCTSLEMAGFSLTLLKLDGELEKQLAAPAECAVRVF